MSNASCKSESAGTLPRARREFLHVLLSYEQRFDNASEHALSGLSHAPRGQVRSAVAVGTAPAALLQQPTSVAASVENDPT